MGFLNWLVENSRLLITFLIILALWLIGRQANEVQDSFTKLRKGLTEDSKEALLAAYKSMGTNLKKEGARENWEQISARFTSVFASFHDALKDVLDSSLCTLIKHMTDVKNMFGDDKGVGNIVVWRILGAVISGLLLFAFLAADIIQAINSLALIPAYRTVVLDLINQENWRWVGRLHISIIVSSIGTSLTLALVYIDARGITHFIPWEGKILSNDVSIREPVKTWSLRLFFVNLLVIAMTASSRLGTVPINNADNLAETLSTMGQVYSIVPMLLTTFVLFYGFMVFVVIYLILLSFLYLFLRTLNGTLFTLKGLFSTLDPSDNLVINIFVVLFSIVVIVSGLVISLFLALFEMLVILLGFIGSRMIGLLTFVFGLPQSLRTIRTDGSDR